MSTSIDAYPLSTLLRISSELDIIGDVTTTVTNPSDLLAWAHALPDPTICAWRAADSGNRYVHVTAACHRTPIHGRVTAVLTGDDHRLRSRGRGRCHGSEAVASADRAHRRHWRAGCWPVARCPGPACRLDRQVF